MEPKSVGRHVVLGGNKDNLLSFNDLTKALAEENSGYQAARFHSLYIEIWGEKHAYNFDVIPFCVGKSFDLDE